MARPRTDICPRIVRAARARFLADGIDGASLRTIAREAGTSIGMVYYYFPTKDDLFFAVIDEVYARFVSDLGGLLDRDAPARERLTLAFERLGNASPDEFTVIRLVVREAILSSSRLKRFLARAREGHVGMLLATLEDGIRRGEIDPQIPLSFLLVTTLAMGGLPQFVRRAVGRNPPFAELARPQRLAQLSAELLFRAVGSRSSRAPARISVHGKSSKKQSMRRAVRRASSKA